MKFDIIIPIATKEAFFVKKTIRYIRKNIYGFETIYIISDSKNKQIIKSLLTEDDIVFIDENELLPQLTFQSVRQCLKQHEAEKITGWFFQQFLKMGFARSLYAKDYYLSWDADTIPLKKLFFEQDSHPIFDKKIEYHEPYFKAIYRLLNLQKEVNFSFIAEHMLFKTSIMDELIETIEAKEKAEKQWWQTILENCDYQESLNCFSEFEMYGTYCHHHYPNLYVVRSLHTFRHAGLISGRFISNDMLNLLSFDLDTASFELRDIPPFPLSIAQYMYMAYIKLYIKFM